MIRGIVNARREAIVQLRLRGPTGAEFDVEAIVDTGFSASLTLPAATVAAMGLLLQSSSQARLADGSVKRFNVYAAEVLWLGVWQPVLVSVVGDEVLMGMRLLADHELRIAVVPGNKVEITPLP